MKLGLTQRTAQHLTLTPQLQQSIRLLQLSEFELSQEVAQHLSHNPFLESSSETDPDPGDEGDTGDASEHSDNSDAQVHTEQPPDELNLDAPWHLHVESHGNEDDSHWENTASPGERAQEQVHYANEEPFWQVHDAHTDEAQVPLPSQAGEEPLQWLVAPTTLQAHLRSQALALRLNDLQRIAVQFVIEHLNEDGWLAEPLETLRDDFALFAQIEPHLASEMLQEGLDHVQQMDPPGVGATDLQSCLRLQLLERLSTPARQDTDTGKSQEQVRCVGLALRVLRQPLVLLAKRDYRQLSKACASGEVAVREACDLIRSLNPHPGLAFGARTAPVVRPDVIVRRQGVRYEAYLAPHVQPRVTVNSRMVRALQADRAARPSSLQDALQEARWLVKSLRQRCDTLLRVSQAIVDHQQAFFAKGPLHLKPMVLREVADLLGLHESTISRITTAKYLTGPQGTVELKYFFTSGLASGDGQSTSSTSVRTLISQWVAAENPKKPLSDQKLSDLLAEKGIDCARRTVAKYRESLKIAPTHLRRID